MNRQKVIARFVDGRLLKGYVDSFSPKDEFIVVEGGSADKQKKIRINELKAIFFVKTFAGKKDYAERKSFTGPIPPGRRVFVRFKDSEPMIGHIEGDMPWEKGFFLESRKKGNGFFLIPVDRESNNIKVFVVASSVLDVALIG